MPSTSQVQDPEVAAIINNQESLSKTVSQQPVGEENKIGGSANAVVAAGT